jgi:transposase
MPRTCTVCSHQSRADIEAALVSGGTLRNVAKRFDVGFSSLNRHVEAGHIQQSIKQEHEAKDEVRALDVARQLHVINTVTLNVMHSALGDKKTHHLVLQAVDRVLRQLELQDKRDKMSELEQEVEALKQMLQANDTWQP